QLRLLLNFRSAQIAHSGKAISFGSTKLYGHYCELEDCKAWEAILEGFEIGCRPIRQSSGSPLVQNPGSTLSEAA
ncbi:hypothetical protein ACCS96_53140, partial [Rhizobium ruizarguesonis]